ncbi:hypothetical protein CEXT_500681 [Caerostris extrusa]|uniref:Uncharacterized protein n=1 Tax=Caerostris extrusa TaxID=172846 RepID=A0AAV4NEU7_CAEEX|nr:hypothetical protein CEXT_500681 [Caerostris extrusa]
MVEKFRLESRGAWNEPIKRPAQKPSRDCFSSAIPQCSLIKPKVFPPELTPVWCRAAEQPNRGLLLGTEHKQDFSSHTKYSFRLLRYCVYPYLWLHYALSKKSGRRFSGSRVQNP